MVHTSPSELEKLLPKGKNEKVIGLMKNELGKQIMKKFAELRAKAYSYLKANSNEDKKAKDKKSVSSRENIKFKIRKPV